MKNLSNFSQIIKSLFIILILLFLTAFQISCANKSRSSETEYGINKDTDVGLSLDHYELSMAIGFLKYDELIEGIGNDNLDRLSYEAGQSNLITFINTVNDMQKIIDLFSDTNKLDAVQVISLLDLTDKAIEEYSPSSEDTIGKIANLINYTTDMNYLKDIVWGVEDFNGKTGMERLCITVALVDESLNIMPIILNEVANTVDGKAVLLRVLNETLDLSDLTTVINYTTTISNLTGVMNTLTNDGKKQDDDGNVLDGTDSMVATLNNTTEPERLAYAINNLNITSNVSNDDDFTSGDFTGQNWARTTTGTHSWEIYSVDGWNNPASVGLHGTPTAGEVISLEITQVFEGANNSVTFDYRTVAFNGDRLNLYIDDVLIASETTSTDDWRIDTTVGGLAAGVHRFRWEFEAISGDTGVHLMVDNVRFTGDRGAALFPYQKVAIILNQLTLSSQNTVPDVFNALDQNGLDNLVGILNKTAFPLNWESETAKFIEVTNNLDSVENLAGFINGLDSTVIHHVVDLMDFVAVTSKMYELINGLGGQPGEKMYQIVNGLTPTGTSALIKIMDGLSITNLLLMVNGVSNTSDMAQIFNNLDLNGTIGVTLNADSSPTGAEKMAAVINDIDDTVAPGNNLTIENHLVRLINDLSDGTGNGAANVGKIVSGLDNTVTPTGTVRMVQVMDNLAVSDIANKYDDPLCDGSTGPATYPVIDYTNSINYYIPDNTGVVSPIVISSGASSVYNVTVTVNISHSYDGDLTLTLKSPAGTVVNLSTKIGGSGNDYTSTVFDDSSGTNISAGSPPFTGIFHAEGNLSDFNGQDSNGTWELKVVDDASNDTGSITGWTLHVTEEVIPPASIDCTSDKFGRLTTFMVDIFGDGADTTVKLINGIDSDKIGNLTDLIGTAKRIRYVTDVINNLTNVDLMLAVLNDPDMESSTMRRLVDTFGDQTYPDRTAYSPRYTDAMSTDQGDGLGRLTVLMNEVVTAYGSANIIALMNDIDDFNKLTGLISGINEDGSAHADGGADRVRYMSYLINNVENIDLLLNIMNGFTSPATSPVDYKPLVELINQIGENERKGGGFKDKGDLSIITGVINMLGWDYSANAPRSSTEQSKLIYLMNGVNRCGIESGYDTNSPASHLLSEPCSNATTTGDNNRLVDFMLGMNDAKPVSIIVGDVGDVNKTINVMNGVRDVERLIDFINYMPGEVTAAFLNANDLGVVFSSTLFMMNNLSAKSLACFIHFGTGLGQNSDRSGTVHYYTGVGPVRMATMMNAETGPRLLNVLNNFGWRTAIASMVCGFGTPNKSTPQYLDNRNAGGSEAFYRTETIDITDDPHYGTYTHTYEANATDCNAYYPEKAYGNVCESKTDPMDHIIWYGGDVNWGFAGCFLSSDYYIAAGISSVWDIINGDGTMATLMDFGGIYIAYPPSPKWWANGDIDPEVDAAIRE